MSRLTIANVSVFDGLTAELADGPIFACDGVITEIGSAPAETDILIDGRGGTAIPGLIDGHFHAYGSGLNMYEVEATPVSYTALNGARRLEAAVRRGFTTVRDVAGGEPGLARAIREGLFPSPRYLFTGPALSQTGGHGDPRRGDLHLCACHHNTMEVVDGVDDLRRAVRERFRQGAHAIKLMTSGGTATPNDPIHMPQYSGEEIRAVVEEAAHRDTYVAAHAYSPAAVTHSVVNGIKCIEHGNLLDEESAQLMAEYEARLMPTLIAHHALSSRAGELGLDPWALPKVAEVRDRGVHAIALARAVGVPIGYGTDLLGVLEDAQLEGIVLQAEEGGAFEALRSATSVNADIIDRPDLGRLTVGSVADIVILPANPLDDINVVADESSERTVIQGGVPL